MCGTRLSLLFVALCLEMLISVRASRNRIGDSSARNRRQNTGNTNEQYSRVCPSVVCPVLPETCETIEFFIMESEYATDGGQRVTIRCQSCEYCLDIPLNLGISGRARRSAQHSRHHHDCSRVSCPDVPSNCADVRMTDVILANTKCRQCPACYDATVFNRT